MKMNKNLFKALSMLILSFVLFSCATKTTNETTGGITGLAVTPHELIFVDGDNDQRLSVTFTPSGANADVVWSSSDTTVATVNNKGVVTPVGYGDAKISATVGKYSDTCYVTVKTFLETLTFNNAIVMSADTLVIDGGQVHDITVGDGTVYKCYLAMATMYVFAEGLYINNSGYFDGSSQGAIIEFEAPMYYGTAYLNDGSGVSISLGDWGILPDQDANTTHVGLPTALDSANYIANMEAFITKYNNGDNTYAANLSAAGNCFTNAKLYIMTYDTDESGEGGYYNSYIPDAVVTYGLFSTNGRSATYRYMLGLDYSTFTYKPLAGDYWGCNLTLNEDQTAFVWVDKYVHFDDEITTEYGEMSASSAKMIEPMHIEVMSIDRPEIYKAINSQLNNHKLIKK